MDEDYKEVYFDQYCKKCKYKELAENEEPCSECLDKPLNLYTHKPLLYEEKQLNN